MKIQGEARRRGEGNIAETRRASSSARASTPRDGTGELPERAASLTIEKETEPNGDEIADDDGPIHTICFSLTDSLETSETGAVSLGEFVRLGAVYDSPSPRSCGRTDRRYIRASSRRPPRRYRGIAGRASISAWLRSRVLRRDSPGSSATPPSANRRAASTRTPGSAPGSPVFSVPGSARPSVPGRPSRRRRRWTCAKMRWRHARRSSRRGRSRRRLQCLRTGAHTKFELGPVILAVELAIGETRDAKTRTPVSRGDGGARRRSGGRFGDAHRLPNSVAADGEVVLEESLRVYFAEAAR